MWFLGPALLHQSQDARVNAIRHRRRNWRSIERWLSVFDLLNDHYATFHHQTHYHYTVFTALEYYEHWTLQYLSSVTLLNKLTSESWGVNGHTTRCIGPVSVVLRLRLMSGWGLRKRRSASPHGLKARERTLLLLLLLNKFRSHVNCTDRVFWIWRDDLSENDRISLSFDERTRHAVTWPIK